MKLAIHIFTFYMFALSLTPCGDGGNGIVDIAKHFFGVEHQHQDISDHDHDHDSNGCDDTCPPFCICSCCSSALDVPIKLSFQLKYLPPKPENKPSFLSTVLPTSFIHSIWHPPIFS